jgi:hypothetical protein
MSWTPTGESLLGPPGPPGPQGPPVAVAIVPTVIGPTPPTTEQLNGHTQFLWWDTSGGALTLWIEDGT